MSHRVYRCRLHHARPGPVAHRFTYPTWMVELDLDALDGLEGRLFRVNGRGLLSVYEADYLGAGEGSLRARVGALLEEEGLGGPIGAARLLTTPRVLGRAFNPFSLIYVYGEDGALRAAVVEVRNTFGEAHVYACPVQQGRASFDKEFFVSPFNRADGRYRLRLPPPDDDLEVQVDLYEDEELVLHARLTGEGRPLSTASLLGELARAPLAASLTLLRISWQALTLQRRGLSARMKPRPDHPRTRVVDQGFALTPGDAHRDARRARRSS